VNQSGHNHLLERQQLEQQDFLFIIAKIHSTYE
jgi:hypothetical protein